MILNIYWYIYMIFVIVFLLVSAIPHNWGGQQGPASTSLRTNFALYNNLKDRGWILDVRFEILSLWNCQFYTVSKCFRWSGPRSYISLGSFPVQQKSISSTGTILQMDQIKRMIPHSKSDKHVTPCVPVKFLLNPSVPCVQVCLLVLNRALGLLT